MSCHCLCFAVHAERGICDVEAPTAFVTMSLEGSALETFQRDAIRTVPMCKPCAEAAVGQHPRALSMVLVDV